MASSKVGYSQIVYAPLPNQFCTPHVYTLTDDAQECTHEERALWNRPVSLRWPVKDSSSDHTSASLLLLLDPPKYIFLHCGIAHGLFGPRPASGAFVPHCSGLGSSYSLWLHTPAISLNSMEVAVGRVEDDILYQNATIRLHRWLQVCEHKLTKPKNSRYHSTTLHILYWTKWKMWLRKDSERVWIFRTHFHRIPLKYFQTISKLGKFNEISFFLKCQTNKQSTISSTKSIISKG